MRAGRGVRRWYELWVSAPLPRVTTHAHPHQHPEERRRVDEQARSGWLALARSESCASCSQAASECFDIFDFDIAHVEGWPPSLEKAVHRASTRRLCDLDAVQPRRRVEHRKRALVAVLRAGYPRELRRVEPERAGVECGRVLPVCDRVGDLVEMADRTNSLSRCLGDNRGGHPMCGGGVENECAILFDELHLFRAEVASHVTDVSSGENDAVEPLAPLLRERLHRPFAGWFKEFKEARAGLHGGPVCIQRPR